MNYLVKLFKSFKTEIKEQYSLIIRDINYEEKLLS